MQPNTNPKTGIRYGIISANSLNQDLLHELLYHVGTDLDYMEAQKEAQAALEIEAEHIEEEVRIALAEIGGWTEREYEAAWDREVEAAYNRLGFDDREDFIESSLGREMDGYYCEEPKTAFEYQGVTGRTTWLGGAMLVWIFDSPNVSTFDLCSPCVPGACELDSPNPDGYTGYTVPNDWLAEKE